MSDVEAGGATVFPYVGARVMPKKVGKHIHKWFVNFALKLKPSIIPEYETGWCPPQSKIDMMFLLTVDLEFSTVLFGEFGLILVRQSKFVNLLSKRI